jgi:hypothetical protein
MLQQPPWHRLEHVKEGEDEIRRSTQERSHILDDAMGVLGLIDGHKNSHIGLLAGRGKWHNDLYLTDIDHFP